MRIAYVLGIEHGETLRYLKVARIRLVLSHGEVGLDLYRTADLPCPASPDEYRIGDITIGTRIKKPPQ